jgi:uncharacterized membrane protein
MAKRFLAAWDVIRTGLWLVPTLMILAGCALAALLLKADAGRGLEDTYEAWWLHSGDAAHAHDLLSTLLSAVITMASLVFSVTIVALTLAANQYGPRLIRIFRADRRTQVILGLFVMTIVYSVLVLRTIRIDAPEPQVPHISVTVGTALSLICVLALLAFVQGVARTIVADEVAKRVGHELHAIVDNLPALDEGAQEERDAEGMPADAVKARPVALDHEGYVQAIDYDAIVAWAEEADARVRIDVRPGHFVARGDAPIRVYGAPADEARIKGAVVIGGERTPTQDLEFAVRHLVEIALRALSPGINDPFTAVAVIDRLRGSLSRIMARRLPPATVRGRTGALRLRRRVTTYEGILDAAFNQIRQAATDHPAVFIQLLDAIGQIAAHACLDEQRRSLARHAGLVQAAAMRAVPEPADRDDIERSFQGAMAAIGSAPEQARRA